MNGVENKFADLALRLHAGNSKNVIFGKKYAAIQYNYCVSAPKIAIICE